MHNGLSVMQIRVCCSNWFTDVEIGLSSVMTGLNGAGWSRQENTKVMPAATLMAGVDMRLEPHAYRELHWHVAGEWALMLNGTARIAVCLPHKVQIFDSSYCTGY